MSQPRFTDKKLVNNKPKNIKKYKLTISLKINNKQATLTTGSNKQFAEHLRLWKMLWWTKQKEWVWTKLRWCWWNKQIWVGHNLPAGIPAKAIVEVSDTYNNKWLMLTSITWITWNLSKEAKENNHFN